MSFRRRINVYVGLLIASILLLTGSVAGFLQWQSAARGHITAIQDGTHLLGLQHAAEAQVALLRMSQALRRPGFRPPGGQAVDDIEAQRDLEIARHELLDRIEALAAHETDSHPILQWQTKRVAGLYQALRSESEAGADSARGAYSADALMGGLEQLRRLHGIEYRRLARELARLEGSAPYQLAVLVGGLLLVGLALVYRLVGLISNTVHQQELAESRLKAFTEELEARVVERTAHLKEAHQQLLRRERLAAIGQLTATVTHELRNPLGTLTTSLYALRERLGQTKDSVIQNLNRMERSVARCNNIVTDLLDFTRTRELMRDMVPVDPFIEESLAELDCPEWLDRVFLGGAGNLVMMLDSDLLRRTLVNLHDNAVQAMDAMRQEAGDVVPRLEVSTAVAQEHLEIHVIDNGPGMSPEVLSQAFEPLFSTKNFGVGLGLPIVRQSIEQQGGSVELVSAPGEGTQVRIRLPITPRSDGPQPESERSLQ